MGKIKTVFVKVFNRPITSNVILMIPWDLALTGKRSLIEECWFCQDPIQAGPFIKVTLGSGWGGWRLEAVKSGRNLWQLFQSFSDLWEVTRDPNKEEERTYSRGIWSGHVWEQAQWPVCLRRWFLQTGELISEVMQWWWSQQGGASCLYQRLWPWTRPHGFIPKFCRKRCGEQKPKNCVRHRSTIILLPAQVTKCNSKIESDALCSRTQDTKWRERRRPSSRAQGGLAGRPFGRMLAAEKARFKSRVGAETTPGAEPQSLRETPGIHGNNWLRVRALGEGAEASDIRVLTVNLTSSVPTGQQSLETFTLQIDTGPPAPITLQDNPNLYNFLPPWEFLNVGCHSSFCSQYRTLSIEGAWSTLAYKPAETPRRPSSYNRGTQSPDLKPAWLQNSRWEIKIHMSAVGTEDPTMTLGAPTKGADLFSYYQQITSMSIPYKTDALKLG